MPHGPHVPFFYLYGEPHRIVDDSFVHAEPLHDRSRPSEWTISPHRHTELHQLFLVGAGSGTMQVDGQVVPFMAPCLLVVPATTVHGFTWQEESTGAVVTLARRYADELARNDASLRQVFASPLTLALSAGGGAKARALVAGLMRELGWSAPGHRGAVDAAVLQLLVLAVRNASAMLSAPVAVRGHYAGIVARFRERIELRFRLREPLAAYAGALGVSATALRVACARVAGMSPMQLLDQRTLLEARRSLLYSNQGIAEIGYSLGFDDPAYFSRFFSRHLARSPGQFRTSERSRDAG